jgi:outer membrane protein assembly factor BamE (lipoprotein component of BamABCDE complex)
MKKTMKLALAVLIVALSLAAAPTKASAAVDAYLVIQGRPAPSTEKAPVPPPSTSAVVLEVLGTLVSTLLP